MLVFAVFLKVDALFRVVDTFVGWGWSFVLVLLAAFLVRMVLAGFVVLVVFPPILGFKRPGDWLPGYLRLDLKVVLLGVLSFVAFCVVAGGVSMVMGIFKGDLSAVLAHPDMGPDRDVIGWGYLFLALIPGIWEELAFRGLVQSRLREKFSINVSVLLSATFFSLFHFSNLLTQAPSMVIGGVVMAFFFGIAWGVMTVRARSVIPAMLSHYLVDSFGMVFLRVDNSNPGLTTGFFLLLTLAFPAFSIMLTRLLYRQTAQVRRAN